MNKSFFDSLCGDSLVDAEELESRGLDAEAMCSPLGLTLTPAGAEEDHHPASLIWNRNGRAGDSLDHKLPIFVAPVTPAASSAAHNAASNASDLERTLPPPHAELVRPIISQPASPGISAAASAMGTMAVLAPKDANDPTDAVSAAAANVRRGLPDAIVPPASNALCASSLLVAPAAAAAATLPLTAPASAAGLPTRNLQAPAEAAESQLLHLAAVSQVKHLVPLRLRCSFVLPLLLRRAPLAPLCRSFFTVPLLLRSAAPAPLSAAHQLRCAVAASSCRSCSAALLLICCFAPYYIVGASAAPTHSTTEWLL